MDPTTEKLWLSSMYELINMILISLDKINIFGKEMLIFFIEQHKKKRNVQKLIDHQQFPIQLFHRSPEINKFDEE